jgi:hypothetical protein
MKLTTIDILRRASVPDPADKIGKVSVSVGGVPTNYPDKMINVQEADEVEVIVGTEKFTANLRGPLSDQEATRVEEAKKARGEKATEAFRESQMKKAEKGLLGDDKRQARTLEKRGLETPEKDKPVKAKI